MTTQLKAPLKRQLTIGRHDYVVTLTPEMLKLVLKGHRKGIELKWTDLVSGDAAMAVALRASLEVPGPKPGRKSRAKRRSS